jgi:hypothetical protein
LLNINLLIFFNKINLEKEKSSDDHHDKDAKKHEEKNHKQSSSKSDKKKHQEPMDVDSDSKNVIF